MKIISRLFSWRNSPRGKEISFFILIIVWLLVAVLSIWSQAGE